MGLRSSGECAQYALTNQPTLSMPPLPPLPHRYGYLKGRRRGAMIGGGPPGALRQVAGLGLQAVGLVAAAQVWCAGVPVRVRCAGVWVRGGGVRVCGCAGMRVCRVPVCRCAGVSVRCAGVWVRRCAGVL